ncbi:MFS transporter [Streptomyces sp. URMC 127]|uniref:MFS transporter n=1 Tax=Streptomyces sp. URMC 127 TaxID=3423402 RepID=UPI003F195F67
MSAAVTPRPRRRPAPPGSLRRNRDFQLLCAGQGLSMLGSGASAVALPLLVLQVTRSPLHVGLVEAVWTGALALACLPAGPVADRFARRTVLLACETGRAVASAALAAVVLTGVSPLPVLLAAGVVLGFLTAPFNAAVLPAVRDVVPESRLATALAVNQVRGQLAYLLGPVIGGVLFEASPSWPFWLDSASYAVSAACVCALRTPMRPPDGTTREGWWRSFTTGIAFLWGERVLRRLTLIASAQNFVFDGVYLAIVVTSAREGASGGSVGMLTALSAVGAMTGVVLAPRAGRLLPPSQVLLVTGVVCTLLVTGMALTASALVLAVLLAGCALAVAVAASVLTVARLLRTPAHLQGRTNSAIGLLFMATPPLGSSLTGLFLGELPGWILFLCFGAVLALLAAASPRKDAFASAGSLDRSNGVGHTRAHAMD